MGRIKTITILAAVLILVGISPALAGQKTVGVIITPNIPYYKTVHEAFTKRLVELGFGKDNLDIIVQRPLPGEMAWTNAARRFVVLEADAIVTYGSGPTLRVMKETKTIPVVFSGVFDPPAVGITGENVTGVSLKLPISALIKHLKKVSHYTTLGVVFSSIERDTVRQVDLIEQLQGQFGFEAVRYDVKDRCEKMRLGNVEALLVTTSSVAAQCSDTIARSARQGKVPAASMHGSGEDKGFVFSIFGDPDTLGIQTAEIITSVIKGKNPSSISIQKCSKTQMVIDVAQASALGLEVPLELLTTATRLIR